MGGLCLYKHIPMRSDNMPEKCQNRWELKNYRMLNGHGH